MTLRHSLAWIAGGVLTLGVVVMVRREPAPAPLPPAPAAVFRAASPPTAAQAPHGRAPDATAVNPAPVESRVGIRLFLKVRSSLRARVDDLLGSGGPRAAYTMLLQELELQPTDLEERVRRAYVLRFLPWLAMKDPTLDTETIDLLVRHAGTDGDPYARYVALAALFDCSAFYTQPTPAEGFFFARIAQRLTPELAGPDQGILDLRRRDFPRLAALARDLYARETDRDTRQLLVELIADEKRSDSAPFLSRVATGDADADIRYWGIEGLADGGKSPAALQALQRCTDDADARNRMAALNGLVRLGVCDDLVVSRLLTTPGSSGALYEILGRAFAASSSPALAARLRESLAAPDPGMRRSALHGIVASGRPDFLADLGPAEAKEQVPELKRGIRSAILRLQGAAAPGSDAEEDPDR